MYIMILTLDFLPMAQGSSMRAINLVDTALVVGVGLLLTYRRRAFLPLRVTRYLDQWAPSAMQPSSLLPVTYVISLSRRPAKRKTALERIAASGLERVVVFDAVDGRGLSAHQLEARGIIPYAGWKLEASSCRFFNRALKWGEIGCALSHHGVWELAHASAEAAVLVVEDDVDFLPDFAPKLAEALAEVEALVREGATPPPDLLYLTRHALKPASETLLGGRMHGRGGVKRVQLVAPAFSYKTTAYVLWREGARKLLASGYLRNLIPVDDFLNVLFCAHEVEAGLARPDLDALFAGVPRLRVLAVRPQVRLCREPMPSPILLCAHCKLCALPGGSSRGSAVASATQRIRT